MIPRWLFELLAAAAVGGVIGLVGGLVMVALGGPVGLS